MRATRSTPIGQDPEQPAEIGAAADLLGTQSRININEAMPPTKQDETDHAQDARFLDRIASGLEVVEEPDSPIAGAVQTPSASAANHAPGAAVSPGGSERVMRFSAPMPFRKRSKAARSKACCHEPFE